MSSLSTKANKSRSPAAKKARATKGKKATKKPQRPGKITASPKSKKLAEPRPKKATSSATKKATASVKRASAKKSVAKKSVAKASKKKAPAKKKSVKSLAGRSAGKPAPRRPAAKKTVAKKTVAKKMAAKKTAARKSLARKAPARRAAIARKSSRQAQAQPKKTATPDSIAAVHAFEQGLKLFHRQDYSSAQSAFETILKKYGDQAEVVAGARTYLNICEQKLASAPPVPRNSDALYNRGVFEMNRGNIRGSIELFEKALKSEPQADYVLYSLAAAHARLSDAPKALNALRRAISLRTVHRSHARRDRDFAGLHNNEDFKQLTGYGLDLYED